MAALALLVGSTASADTITFDPGGFEFSVAVYQQVGFKVTFDGGGGYLLSTNNCTPTCADDGSRYALVSYDINNTSLTLTKTDNTPFALLSFLGAENPFANQSQYWATGIGVLATLVGGGSISQSFTLDQIMDGTGGSADFQSFALNGGFGNILSARFTPLGGGTLNNAFSLDTIEVASPVGASAVPEPIQTASLLLLGVGLLGVAAKVWHLERS